jgi:hypothetical protein
MSPRDDLAAETREWLIRASADLRACVTLIAADLPSEALFHAQQCAEKAMKALLAWREITFGKTHDLGELKQRCLPLFPAGTLAMTGIERLSMFHRKPSPTEPRHSV